MIPPSIALDDHYKGDAWEDWLTVRNDEMKQFAMQRYINSARDLHITLTKQ